MSSPIVYYRLPFLALTLSTCVFVWPHPSHSLESNRSDDKSESTYILFATDVVSRRVKRSDYEYKPRDQIRKTPYDRTEKMDMLKKHNELRSITKDAGNMLMMEWNADLEKEAQRWADRCDFNHPRQARKLGGFDGIGQNLYVSTSEPALVGSAIQDWYDEIQFYTYSSRRCVPGQMCGHYTQVVWSSSYAVGCAIKYCNPLTSVPTFSKGYLVVCEYGPPGNYIGRHPYILNKTVCGNCPKKFKYCVRKLCSKRPFIGSSSSSLHHTHPSSLPAMSVLLSSMAAILSLYLYRLC